MVVHQGSGTPRASPLRNAAAKQSPVVSAFPDADAKGLTSTPNDKQQDEEVESIHISRQERVSSGSFSSASTVSGSSLVLSANIKALDIPLLRAEQVGVDRPISTPIGERTL
eukprot:scaffold94740_cov23-Tisochrysis_lutea.AAC.1